jgi:2-keto-4-pentenoate hydratase/2-oxohepta-3-ene-1,7-dioic acid hydratase in catechol pathway
MRIASLNGRASLVISGGFIDVHEASEGKLSTSIRENLSRLDELRALNATLEGTNVSADDIAELSNDERLDVVVDSPQQIFCVGLNYREHAVEMGLASPKAPMVFTKFVSALSGQHALIPVVSEQTDWEAELVVVIGSGGRNIDKESALDAVAGFAVGQDVSDRILQMAGTNAQFSMGKSWPNFGPVGPWITTLDEIAHPEDLAISCAVSGTMYQDSRTSDMVFSVSEIVSYLSTVVELRPGDLIFTGSPHGVGQGQTPPLFLKPGDNITTAIEGLGILYCEAVAAGS